MDKILIIIGVVVFILGLVECIYANKIKVDKKEQLITLLSKESELQERISELEEYKTYLYDNNQQERQKIYDELSAFKAQISSAKASYFNEIEKTYDSEEKKFDQLMQEHQTKFFDAETKLTKIIDTINAGTAAILREKEKEEKLDFYKLKLSPQEQEDVNKLENLKPSFHQPIVISKLIWSQFFQKQTTELCTRVFGKDDICGIYKITDTKTGQCYIGQSVTIQDRIKSHIKCGLGIDTPAMNKLYKAMQNDGIQNFTFELMEKCTRAELNEKEKKWIELYKANTLGLNSTIGGSKT